MSLAKKTKSIGKQKTSRKVQFLQKPSCTTCRKARKFMEDRGFQLSLRDLDKEKLSVAEIEKLIGDRDYRQFLNSRNELYRSRNMKAHPPSREDVIRMMAETPNLIRRPVIISGDRVLLGFDEKSIVAL